MSAGRAALKIGLMVPANNTTMEVELPAWLPVGSTVTTVKIPRGPGMLTKEVIPAYRDSAIALARQHFADGDFDLIAYGCTAAGFLSGPAGDAELSAMLSEATGLPVVTIARAMVRALQHDKAKRIAVVTPYHDAVNAQLAAFLADGGISVVRMDTFRAPDVAALGRITATQVRDLARATMGPDCDALFIGCSQLPTQAILADLEAEFGRPAWSSIRATAWDAGRLRRLPHDLTRDVTRGRKTRPLREERMRPLLRGALGAALLYALVPQAQAQTFPDRAIRMVVPYGTGGITDIAARILSPRLGEELGQQVFVDNRPGGAGMIGFGATANAPADGHTLVLATTALAANPVLFKSIPYDARKSFAPISLVGVVPMVLVVPPSTPANTIAELVALARAKPGELNYGSAGNGSDNHLTAELFNHLAGIKVMHVPYRGGGQVMTDLSQDACRSFSPPCRRRCRISARGGCARWRPPDRPGARRFPTCPPWGRRRCRPSRSMPGSGCSDPPAFPLRSSTGSTRRP